MVAGDETYQVTICKNACRTKTMPLQKNLDHFDKEMIYIHDQAGEN